MRLIYLDEAGISNLAQEPIMIVAGIAVNADRQLQLVEAHLDEIAKKHLPDDMQRRVPFRATELFHGTKNFPRDKWPFEKRLEILDDLAAIPQKFDLPICAGGTQRAGIAEALDGPVTPTALEQIVHAHSFFKFVVQMEVVMHATASDEVAMLIAEDRPIVRRMLKLAHAALRGRAPDWVQRQMNEAVEGIFSKMLPLKRIVETVHFADKNESRLLQIADLCAFAIKRDAMKASHSERLFSALRPQVVFKPEVIAALSASLE